MMSDATKRNTAPPRDGDDLSIYESLRIEAIDALTKLRPFIPSRGRDFRAYAIGLPRSGTHSLAFTFAGGYRTKHEPLAMETVAHLLRWKRGDHTDDEMRRLLQFRDRLLQLEMEASFFMHHFAALLPDLFLEACFVLTVREPRAWMESLMNQTSYSWGRIPFWRALAHYRYDRYGLDFEHEALRNATWPGIFPIRCYLRYWVDHLTDVLASIPENRLLVVDTYTLDARTDEIAAFVGASPSRLNRKKIHSGKQHAKRIRLRDLVPEDALAATIREECLPLIEERFPFLLSHMAYLSD